MSKSQSKNIHVVPRDGAWAVRRDGNERASSTHPTQEEARQEAVKIAKKEKTEVVIHRPDGRIRERDSYGNDPLPPKTPRKILFPKSDNTKDEKRTKH
jgi:uncharacterized protein DUF2188